MTVVLLSPTDDESKAEEDQDCVVFWPKNGETVDYGHFKVWKDENTAR